MHIAVLSLSLSFLIMSPSSLSSWKSRRSKSMKLGQSEFQQSSSNHKWFMLWRRIRRAKKKSSESSLQTYDPHSYLQNFDEGSAAVEPDNLYRSFSARYANPSRFDHRKAIIDV